MIQNTVNFSRSFAVSYSRIKSTVGETYSILSNFTEQRKKQSALLEVKYAITEKSHKCPRSGSKPAYLLSSASPRAAHSRLCGQRLDLCFLHPEQTTCQEVKNQHFPQTLAFTEKKWLLFSLFKKKFQKLQWCDRLARGTYKKKF